jgi:hypothetical protein
MNERIKQLAIEAKLIASEYNGFDHTRLSISQQRFAELIVRECIRELEISRKCDPYTGDLFNCEYNTCINEQTIVLKEHFGVKE